MTKAEAGQPLRMDGVSVLGGKGPEDADTSAMRLSDVRLTLAPGEWLYIVGVNGSGKSTLARLLAGLYVEGAYGHMTRGFAGEAGSPIVLQQPEAQLFGETPREEIAFALEWKGWPADRIASRTEETLRRVGLSELADEPWDALSGGQRQLAAFAAASATGAPLLVLDEATSMLDESNRAAIAREARRMQREGAAVVWVTQRLDELAPDARVVAVREGRVVYDGDAETFLHGRAEDAAAPCEQAGLRLPYLAGLRRELRQGQGAARDARLEAGESDDRDLSESEVSPRSSLRIDGLSWRKADEGRQREEGLTLSPGTLTLMIGGNGVGKTTLMEKIAGLRPPEGLRVLYGDEPAWVADRTRRTLNAKALLRYSYAPQSPESGLFSHTVEAELRYSARPYGLRGDALHRSSLSALSAVGWDESWLTRDPYRMSGGERRRAALAAAFAPHAPWLLLDEPTAGLDGEGHSRLADELTAAKARGTGILLVSHELDWALSLADSVWIMNPSGEARLCTREQLLENPDWLAEAGIGVPPWLRAARSFYARGVAVDRLWRPEQVVADLGDMNVPDFFSIFQSEESVVEPRVPPRTIVNRSPRHRLGTFDPRTIWLSYVLLSIGIFAQRTWLGVAGAGVVTVFLLLLGRISLWRWRKLLRTYATFSVMASAFFAVGVNSGGVTFSLESFAGMLLPFSRTYIVLLLGLCIPLVMTPLALRNALLRLLSFRGRTPAFAHRLVLTVTIMIRFIPVLVAEWGKFSRIHLSRGKKQSRGLLAIVRKMREMTLPFMLSMFRLGDDIAIALESRGVAPDKRPTRTESLRWAVRDYALVCASLALAGLMWGFAKGWTV